jgi:hypothetical protein
VWETRYKLWLEVWIELMKRLKTTSQVICESNSIDRLLSSKKLWRVKINAERDAHVALYNLSSGLRSWLNLRGVSSHSIASASACHDTAHLMVPHTIMTLFNFIFRKVHLIF